MQVNCGREFLHGQFTQHRKLSRFLKQIDAQVQTKSNFDIIKLNFNPKRNVILYTGALLTTIFVLLTMSVVSSML